MESLLGWAMTASEGIATTHTTASQRASYAANTLLLHSKEFTGVGHGRDEGVVHVSERTLLIHRSLDL